MNQCSKLHLIGNAHLDPVWLWRWQEGYAEIKATFRSALDRLQEYPEFVFTCACAAYYEWIEQNAPEMFGEIARRVAEGRWVIVGGWWIQPDCNLPSGESFARHGLISQRYFKEKFGVMARTGYNVDSFGHNGMLPQILRLSGMDAYVYQRPDEGEKDLPHNLFLWESPDGSRVTAFKLPFGYCHAYGSFGDGPDERLAEREQSFDTRALKSKFEAIAALGNSCGTDMMAFYGVGNHGGGPTARNLELIRRLAAQWGGESLFHSSPDAYFRAVEADNPNLPVVTGDLQHHARGCYSAHSEVKASNRRAEHRLITAEKFSALAHGLLGFDYPAENLKSAWKHLLFNQFHDILGGCSIREAYDDAREQVGESLSRAATALNAATQKLSWAIDTLGDGYTNEGKIVDWRLWEAEGLGAPLVVFNPLGWPVAAPVQVNREVAAVTDGEGTPLPVQKVRSSQTNGHDKWDTLFVGQIPAMGYRVYHLHTAKSFDAPASGLLEAGGDRLENDTLLLEFDGASGMLRRILDKRSGADVLKPGGMAAVVLDETHCDTWAHGVPAFDREVGRFGLGKLCLIEAGPLRARLRSTSSFGQSTLRMDYLLYRHSPVVEVRVRVDWRERHSMLKLSFPINVEGTEAITEIPYGFLARTADGGEEPGQQWLDVSGAAPGGGRLGLSLINDSKYGYSVLGSDMRLTCVRSPIYADHYGHRDDECEFMDQGVQEFRLALAPHGGDWCPAQTARLAYELNVPVLQVPETHHRGVLPQRMEGVAIGPDNIVLTAFKRAEDGDGYILRCHEAAGRATEAAIELPPLRRAWQASFGPSQIKTFFLPDDGSKPVSERNLLEFPQEL